MDRGRAYISIFTEKYLMIRSQVLPFEVYYQLEFNVEKSKENCDESFREQKIMHFLTTCCSSAEYEISVLM